MGLLYSYCKKCNNQIVWFRFEFNYIVCKKCNILNNQNDLLFSLNNENYWIFKNRKEKIKNIINRNENSTND